MPFEAVILASQGFLAELPGRADIAQAPPLVRRVEQRYLACVAGVARSVFSSPEKCQLRCNELSHVTGSETRVPQQAVGHGVPQHAQYVATHRPAAPNPSTNQGHIGSPDNDTRSLPCCSCARPNGQKTKLLRQSY